MLEAIWLVITTYSAFLQLSNAALKFVHDIESWLDFDLVEFDHSSTLQFEYHSQTFYDKLNSSQSGHLLCLSSRKNYLLLKLLGI